MTTFSVIEEYIHTHFWDFDINQHEAHEHDNFDDDDNDDEEPNEGDEPTGMTLRPRVY